VESGHHFSVYSGCQVGNCNGCLKFEFNDIPLYTKNNSEWRRPKYNCLANAQYTIYIYMYIIICVNLRYLIFEYIIISNIKVDSFEVW